VPIVRSYSLLLQWQALRLKQFLVLGIVIQLLFAAGIVLGYPLLFPGLDTSTILFLATGAPAIALITIGLVGVPQMVSQAKTEGSIDYMRSLPIPRLVYLFADMTVLAITVVPGVIFGVAVGALRFNLPLVISPMVVPAILLVIATTTSMGYAIAMLLPATVATMATQVLVVFVLMFSPLNFPPERLPDWLAAIHRFLPIQAMGEVIRGTLASNAFPLNAASFVNLGVWCVASFVVTALVLARRG